MTNNQRLIDKLNFPYPFKTHNFDKKITSEIYKMTSYHLITMLFILTLSTCKKIDSGRQSNDLTAEQLYKNAGKIILERDCDSTVVLLEHAIQKGIKNPMRIILDTSFHYLLDNPDAEKIFGNY